MTCEHCDDGEGHSVYPYYGLAPHRHECPSFKTIFLPKEEWPENFSPDPDDESAGTYTHCTECRSGSKQ